MVLDPRLPIQNFRKFVGSQLHRFGLQKVNQNLIRKPLDPQNIEVLLDSGFQASVNEVKNLTLLDIDRLANLWQLCQMSNPKGDIIELGTYQGGGALHLSNSAPQRHIFVCDTFEGFGELAMDPHLDKIFKRTDFDQVSFENVKKNWDGKNRKVTFVKGYFPESAKGKEIKNISFAHIDLDIYESTIESLNFLRDKFIAHSLIVFDDYLRKADGVMKAIKEFESSTKDWRTFPLFPGQGLMLHRSWFE